MLIENENLYEALAKKLKETYTENTFIFVNAIYEPDYDGGPHEGMYHAAVDLVEPGETHHVWFVVNDDDSILVDDIERWFMG
jgi:hypothetical protein